MRIIFGGILMAVLALQAPGAVRTIIPNGGAGAGSLSFINAATGTVDRSLVTATSSSANRSSPRQAEACATTACKM